MTLREVASQVHALSHGRVNGEKFTKRELKNVFTMWMRESTRYIGEITLADGNWLFALGRYADEYDYWIPDTREQEQRLYDALGISYKVGE